MNVTGLDRRLYGRHPFQLLMMSFGFASGVPTIFGAAPRPGSIDEQLPPWLALTWAVVLTLCSLLAVVGVFVPDRGLGLVLEQLGVAGAGLGALLYVACAVATVGTFQVQMGFLMGFGVACLWRWVQLQSTLNAVKQESDRRHE